MTSKKKTPTAKTDWAAQMATLGPIADKVAFQRTPAAFQHTLAPAAPDAPLVIVRAKVRAGEGATSTLLRLPKETRERLDALTVGPSTVVMAALIDWGLDYLEATHQAIEVADKAEQG